MKKRSPSRAQIAAVATAAFNRAKAPAGKLWPGNINIGTTYHSGRSDKTYWFYRGAYTVGVYVYADGTVAAGAVDSVDGPDA